VRRFGVNTVTPPYMQLVRAIVLGAAMGTLGAFLVAAPAHAQNCPGNPNALGTSRVLVVGPTEYTRVGTMQYPQTLPLADKEVVLTFDDGPLPRYSNKILDILTSECVKATFFTIGRMAGRLDAGRGHPRLPAALVEETDAPLHAQGPGRTDDL
jgi:hypothetical protein